MEQECFVCSDWVGVLVGDERVGRPGWKGLLGDCLRKSRGGRGGDREENWYTWECRGTVGCYKAI